MSKICKVNGCKDKVKTKGYCNRHYHQIRKYGKIIRVGKKKLNKEMICKVDRCEENAICRGYCDRHYGQIKKSGEITKIEKKRPNKEMTCKVSGCNNIVKGNGYCGKHWYQIRYHGEIINTIYNPNEVIEYDKHYGIILKNKNQEIVAETLIDKEDYEKVVDYKWHLIKSGYSATNIKRKIICMHRFICPDFSLADHINRDPLDNRKKNLRECTQAENNMNKGKSSKNTSSVSGVTWAKREKLWHAVITKNYTRHSLGYYRDFNDAVQVRQEAELKYFGKFAPQRNLIKDL